MDEFDVNYRFVFFFGHFTSVIEKDLICYTYFCICSSLRIMINVKVSTFNTLTRHRKT